MNLVPGFYWVQQYKNSQKPTIARLTNNSGWEYMASEHSNKMIKNSPFKILSERLNLNLSTNLINYFILAENKTYE